jgi:transcriptional regulator with XRE-family HTH domain
MGRRQIGVRRASNGRHIGVEGAQRPVYHGTMSQPQPNTALRAARLKRRMSQEDLARAVRDAGTRTGEPNACNKRTVQKWESGLVTTPRGIYIRALEFALGEPIENLGFIPADQKYGLDRDAAMTTEAIRAPDPKATQGPLTGIWLSRYEYVSSGRSGETFSDEHYVMLIQHGANIQVRSLSESNPSTLIMDLTQNGAVITGTWSERTNPNGYYQGSVYHGAIQFLLDPTGHRMRGQWVGYGRDFDLNTGPWTLELVSSDTSKDSVERFNRRPEPTAAPS